MADAVLLQGGLVIDGSGGPSWPGDVLIVGDRIAGLGEGLRDRLPAGLAIGDVRVVDCCGHAIAPGFIDAHTHDDAIVLRDPGCLQAVARHHHRGDHSTPRRANAISRP